MVDHVRALAASGRLSLQARFDAPHVLQLVDQLLRDPGRARPGFDLGGRELHGLRLMVSEGATSFDGWRIAEVEVMTP